MSDPHFNPKKLAIIGKKVNAHLSKNTLAQKIPNEFLDFYVIQNFLSPDDCDLLIKLIDQDSVPSQLYIGTEQEGFRTSSSCNLNPHDPNVKAIQNRVSDALGLKEQHSETLQGQRYEVGQQFKDHHDFFHIEQDYWQLERNNGGQRSWTAMIYLNDDLEGGTTEFPDARLGVRPLKGMLATWNNMKADGTQNPYSLHSGKPVTKGCKYIVTKWFRQNKWG